jgi:hypothetical protein
MCQRHREPDKYSTKEILIGGKIATWLIGGIVPEVPLLLDGLESPTKIPDSLIVAILCPTVEQAGL